MISPANFFTRLSYRTARFFGGTQADDNVDVIHNSNADTVFRIDKEWRFTYFNKNATEQMRVLGKDPVRLIGRVMWEEFPNSPNEKGLRRAMSERVPITDELYYPPLGEWVENRMYPDRDGGLWIFQKYITERKKTEEQLRRSEASLAEAQRISRTGSWFVSLASGAIEWSREAYRIYGVDPKVTLHDSTVFQLIHPDDRTNVREAFARAVRQKSDYDVEHRAILPDGTVKFIHSLGHPVLNESGALIEFVGTAVDLTERRLAEERLKESECRFRELAEMIPQQVWSYRGDGTLEYVNQRWLHYTGVTWEEARRTGGHDLVHPDDGPVVEKARLEASAKGRSWEVELRLRRGDGSYRRFLSRGVPIYADSGAALRWLGTNTDIEDRSLAEEALRTAQAELARATRVTAIGELTVSLAHQLNQPLAAIISNGGAALRWIDRRDPDLGEAMGAIRRMIRDANRAGDEVAHVRSALRKSGSEKELVDVREVIQDVLISIESEIARHRIGVHQSCAAAVPSVLGSKVELRQVMLNLVMNAIESMADVSDRNRSLFIVCESHPFHERTGVLVAVRDVGIGIASHQMDRLFESFYTTKPTGLGIGLLISRSIVEAHGGVLWAEGNPGRGATFQFLLPAQPAGAADSADAAGAGPAGPTGS
jgi:PAS domain S-box-containing protein